MFFRLRHGITVGTWCLCTQLSFCTWTETRYGFRGWRPHPLVYGTSITSTRSWPISLGSRHARIFRLCWRRESSAGLWLSLFRPWFCWPTVTPFAVLFSVLVRTQTPFPLPECITARPPATVSVTLPMATRPYCHRLLDPQRRRRDEGYGWAFTIVSVVKGSFDLELGLFKQRNCTCLKDKFTSGIKNSW